MRFFKLLIIHSLYMLFFSTCQNIPGNQPGNLAPDFKIKDINQQTQSLSQYKGKVVLLHFWTDFCQSCRAEFPRMQAAYQALKSNDFELLAINIGQPSSVSKDFQKDFEVSFPMLVDIQKVTKDLYAINAFPTNYFINPEGKIIRRITGWLTKNQIEVIINQHKLKEKKASIRLANNYLIN